MSWKLSQAESSEDKFEHLVPVAKDVFGGMEAHTLYQSVIRWKQWSCQYVMVGAKSNAGNQDMYNQMYYAGQVQSDV